MLTGDQGIFTIAGMLLGALIGYRTSPGLHLMEYPRGAGRMMVATGVLFIGSLLFAIRLLEGDVNRPVALLVALAPVLPATLFVFALGKGIASLDEMQKRIQLEAIAIGFGLAGLLHLIFGMLGLVGYNQPGGLFLILIMMAGWLAGKLWVRWKSR